MELTLINELFESRLFPARNSTKKYTAEDISNMTFLNFLALQILKSEFDTANFATDYLYQTFKFGNFDRVQNSSTDLFWMLNILLHKDSEMLNGHPGNDLELEKISLDEMALKTWARQAIKIRSSESVDRRFLLSLESALCIRNSDYRSIRLLASSWSTLTDEQRQLAMTRLLFAFRKRMPRSELLSHLEELAKHKKLEIHGAKNPEHDDSPTTKSGLIKKLAIGAAVAGAIALPIIGDVKRHREFKNKVSSMQPRKWFKEEINEDGCASGGSGAGGTGGVGLGSSTSSGNIASYVSPLGGIGVISRVKRGKRKKKKKV